LTKGVGAAASSSVPPYERVLGLGAMVAFLLLVVMLPVAGLHVEVGRRAVFAKLSDGGRASGEVVSSSFSDRQGLPRAWVAMCGQARPPLV